MWYRSGWYLGFVLAFLSYGLVALNRDAYLALTQIWIPLGLTAVALRYRGRQRQQAAFWSCVMLLAVQFLTIPQPETRLIGLGVGTVLMTVNTYFLPHLVTAALNLGFAFSFAVALFWGQLSLGGWLVFGAVSLIVFCLLEGFLARYQSNLPQLYAQAANIWSIILCLVELLSLTFVLFLPPSWQYFLASLLTGIALVWRYWRQPGDIAVYGIGWALEIVLVEGILLTGGTRLTVATANIILALLTLGLTARFLSPNSLLSSFTSLQLLPLVYALIGIVCRLEYFTATTGFLTLGAAITGMGIAARLQDWKWLSYVSFAAISSGCYELVLYQMSQATGGSTSDAFTILAIVTAAIALIYRLFVWWWRSQERNTFLNLSLREIIITAHIHWAIASILDLAAATLAVDGTPQLSLAAIGVSLILAAYALIQGRDRYYPQTNDWWVYVGIVETIATTIYARLIWTQLSFLDPWRVILACLVALFILQLPWQSLGWQTTPWHRAALAIPAVTALVSTHDIALFSLLVVAVFYGRIAYKQRNIRWSYLSLGFVDWAIVKFCLTHNLTDILWYASILGLSLLYIAQFDPSLIQPQSYKLRHYWRVVGSGIICLTALLFHQDTGILPATISLLVIFLGLGLRIRAFLFVGTINFILTAFYQLVVLIFTYSFLKWIVGLMAGIILITVAAKFEQRREQINVTIQHWVTQLNSWE